MVRNNYYQEGSLPDDQNIPSYATNVPSSPDGGNNFAAMNGQEEYVGATRGIDGDTISSGYTSTVPLEMSYGVTEVVTDEDSIYNVNLVVGWLVCIKGANIGRDYRLHVGWNYIGRESSMDVYLPDPKVSHRMAKISYDPESRTFGIAPCEGAKSLSYLNDKPLRGDRDIEAYDRIRIGDTELMLIPLCSDRFAWEFDK